MSEETDGLEECITQHMEEDDMTREEATVWCERRLDTAEKSFQKMMKQKALYF